jgi:hypothetical protein
MPKIWVKYNVNKSTSLNFDYTDYISNNPVEITIVAEITLVIPGKTSVNMWKLQMKRVYY